MIPWDRVAWLIGIGFTKLTYILDGIFLIYENVLAHLPANLCSFSVIFCYAARELYSPSRAIFLASMLLSLYF